MCLSSAVIGYLNYMINGTELLKGSITGFRVNAMLTLLFQAIVLEPLNLFLYTWRFLVILEEEAESNCVKMFIRWFALITIFTLPAAFYAIFAAVVIEYGFQFEYFFEHNF